MKQTPLYDWHKANGATFVEFSGFDMPVHYGSIKDEHFAVRSHVGAFDVSHMSNVRVKGENAIATLDAVMTRSVSGMEIGKGLYGVILNPDGTILDDIFVFRTAHEEFFTVPNAGMNELVAARLAEAGDAEVIDESANWAIIAVQGPKARELLGDVVNGELPRFHRIVEARIAEVKVLISGTGYTGEKGVEIYAPASTALQVWKAIMEHPIGAHAIGLGARDTLRLEKGYCLAGHEFEGGRTPVEAGLDFAINWAHNFPGRAKMEQQRNGEHQKLFGLILDKGIPRQGYPVIQDGSATGIVTSGTQSPTLGKGIALAYLPADSQMGSIVNVEIRGKMFPATLVVPPFI